MTNPGKNNIQKMRKLAGMTREQLAARLNVTATTIYRKESGDRGLDTKELEAFATALNCSPADLLTGSGYNVPVIGYVGAGAMVYPIDDHQLGDGLEYVESPVGIADKEIVAIYVRGDSQLPQLEDGWVLFYRKRQEGVPADCIGKLCVVMLKNDGMLVKKVRQGSKPGLFHLLSSNADPMLDVQLVWAAKIIDIRPT